MSEWENQRTLFDEDKSEVKSASDKVDSASNPRDQAFLRILRDDREAHLSPYAFKSKDTRGRKKKESPCTVRSDFERDIGRIIYSQAFRRLRHKTQVFFNPQNDHICSRIEHVIYVSYIAKTIARALNLNLDLVEAIALSHDLGHAPFGHSGEKALDRCVKHFSEKAFEDTGHKDEFAFFQHELHGLRVVDLLLTREKKEGIEYGLNLSFEVRDGIASHCGETYSEFSLQPFRDKGFSLIESKPVGRPMPATLEGCVVRLADKIAYVGRDIEDAAIAGLMDFSNIPPAIASTLGSNNSQIIHTLVTDIIHNSLNRDEIILSGEAGEAMEALLEENVKRIYQSSKVKAYEERVALTIKGLFDALMDAVEDMEKLRATDNPAFSAFFSYSKTYPDKNAPNYRMVLDYIAGMTDSYADKCYQDIYWI